MHRVPTKRVNPEQEARPKKKSYRGNEVRILSFHPLIGIWVVSSRRGLRFPGEEVDDVLMRGGGGSRSQCGWWCEYKMPGSCDAFSVGGKRVDKSRGRRFADLVFVDVEQSGA